MKLKYAVFISLFLHFLSLLPIFLKKQALKNEPIQITVNEKKEKPKKAAESKIIPKISSLETANRSKNGFWGVGITHSPGYTPVEYRGNIIMGMEIDAVIEGYPADEAGLRPGDVIVACDGHFDNPTDHIRGTGPTPIQLVVVRNRKVLTFVFNRGWISTDSP